MYEHEQDDDEYEYDERDEPFCYECQNTGSVPAHDYESILGFSYFACPKCERGFDSEYPLRN